MTSEISNSAARSAPGLQPQSGSHITAETLPKTASVEIPSQPKVTAPKPIDIQFDPAEVRQNLQEAVNILNNQLNEHNRGIGFSIDDTLNTPIVTVRSTETGEVVRQLPNEAVVRVAHSIESIKGLLINANV